MSAITAVIYTRTSSLAWYYYTAPTLSSTSYTKHDVAASGSAYASFSIASNTVYNSAAAMYIPVRFIPATILETSDYSTDPGDDSGLGYKLGIGWFSRSTMASGGYTINGEECSRFALSAKSFWFWLNMPTATKNKVTFNFTNCIVSGDTASVQMSDDGSTWSDVDTTVTFDYVESKYVKIKSSGGTLVEVSQLAADGLTVEEISASTFKVTEIPDAEATYAFTGSWYIRKSCTIDLSGMEIPDGLTLKYGSTDDIDSASTASGSTSFTVYWTDSRLYLWFVNDSGKNYGGTIDWSGDESTPVSDFKEYDRDMLTNIVNGDTYYGFGEFVSPKATTTSVPQPVIQGTVIEGYTWNVTFPVDTTTTGFNAILTCPDGYKFDESQSNSVTVDSVSHAFVVSGSTLTVSFSQLDNVKTWTITCYMVKEEEPTPTVTYPSFVTAYLPNTDDVAAIKSAIWIDSEGEVISAASNIISYKQIFDTLTSDKNKVMKFGGYSLGRNVAYVEDNQYIRKLGYIEVPAHWGNADDYKNTTYTLYVPLVGYVELEPERIVGHKLYLEYRYEIQDGKALSVISSDDTGEDDLTIVSQGSCNFAIDEPIGTDIGTSYANSYWTIMSAQLGDLRPYLLIRRHEPVGSSYGENNTKEVKVKECSGYVQFSEIFVEGIECTKKEYSEILSKLKSGIIV